MCKECRDCILARCGDRGRTSAKCPDCGKAFFQFDIGSEYADTKELDLRDVDFDDDLPVMANNMSDDPGYITMAGRKIKGRVPKSKGKTYPGDDYNGWQPETRSSSSKWLDLGGTSPAKPVIPSTKTTAALEVIQKWQQTDPSDKILVFLKWAVTAKVSPLYTISEVLLHPKPVREHWKPLRPIRTSRLWYV